MNEAETIISSAKLDNTIGALELGSLLAMFMFGIVTLQTYSYYTHISDKDRLLYRVLVSPRTIYAYLLPLNDGCEQVGVVW